MNATVSRGDELPRHLARVGRAAVAAAVGREHAEALRERRQVVLPRARVRVAGVEEQDGLARAVLLVVGVDVAELDRCHALMIRPGGRSHRSSVSQYASAAVAIAAPMAHTASQPPAVHASEEAAEPSAPPANWVAM